MKEQESQKKQRRRESREQKRQSKVNLLVQTEANKSLLERLLESNALSEIGENFAQGGKPIGQVMHTLREVSILEEKAAKSYIQHRSHELDVTIVAGYSPCVRRELNGVWSKIEKRDGRPVVPSHLTRLLTLLAQEKEHLHHTLRGVSISHPKGSQTLSAPSSPVKGESGEKGGSRFELGLSFDEKDQWAEEDGWNSSDSDASDASIFVSQPTELYADYLFREVCATVLDIYHHLISSLLHNRLFIESGQGQTSSQETARATQRERENMGGSGSGSGRGSLSANGARGRGRLASLTEEETDVEMAANEKVTGHGNSQVCLAPLSLGRAVEEARFLLHTLFSDHEHGQKGKNGDYVGWGEEGDMAVDSAALRLEKLLKDAHNTDNVRRSTLRRGKPFLDKKFLSVQSLKDSHMLYAFIAMGSGGHK